MNTIRHCQSCGAPLPDDAPSGLCPACLLKSDAPTSAGPEGSGGGPSRDLPAPGQTFGGYRIVREIGRGGMGAVYEAEETATGRRVALKVLAHALDSPESRARFLREGRLAASINHPNSVYVFGTAEIEGTPVICMELVAGGTLQERVKAEGPLPVGEAVDAVLQLIDGLEAAQAIGILHRDIKPSNCFVDPQGLVKIGDFGLSISTAGRAESNVTTAGTVLGTPAFASPEQLRGEELNARSDLYSVGVTLFYLLTGRTPFEADNFVKLLSKVLEEPPPAPSSLRPEIPPQLDRIILKCLAKQPAERFARYAELRRALQPFSSTAPRPAPLGLRFAAGFLDFLVPMVIGYVSSMFLADPMLMDSTGAHAARRLITPLTSLGLVFLYFSLCEWRWGATAGKALCGLRVLRPDRRLPAPGQALGRAAIYVIVPTLFIHVVNYAQPYWFVEMEGFGKWLVGMSQYLILALLFSTARARNGLAAVHDLLTGTRVVQPPVSTARPAPAGLPSASEAEPAPTDQMIGPYHVLEPLGDSGREDWLVGYDTKLLRKVWLHRVPPGTPPVPPPLRTLARPGRLRWLDGHRPEAAGEPGWDAWEAPTGRPLVEIAHRPQSWAAVRYWLLDLATELNAATPDGTRPAVLALDRVWITADSRVKLLDFPAPGLPMEPSAGESTTGVSDQSYEEPLVFLQAVARTALNGLGHAAADSETPPAPQPPPPLHARDYLEKLTTLPEIKAAVDTLRPLLQRPAAVSRARRLAILGGCALFPVLTALGMMIGQRVMSRWQAQQPKLMELVNVLQTWNGGKTAARFGAPVESDRQFQIYIHAHFGEVITNQTVWHSTLARSLVGGKNRRFAEAAMQLQPPPTPEEVKQAEEKLRESIGWTSQPMRYPIEPRFILLAAVMGAITYVGLPAIVAALLFRGGLVLLAAGVVVVRPDGRRASRGRTLWRALLAWSPFWAGAVLLALLTPLAGATVAGWTVGLPGVALILGSALSQERGWHDRLAGTWLVPR